MIFSAVPSDAINLVWEDVFPLLGPALRTAEGKFHIDDVYRMIQSGNYILWVVVEDDKYIAALTTRVLEYPSRRAIAIDWLGGKRMNEWLPVAMETVKKYAKDINCKHLEGYGRKAWGRVLEKHNWEPEYIAYRMELSDG